MHLAPALPERILKLEKNGLAITLRQLTDARGAVYTFWGVTLGGRTVKTGLFERDHGIPAILKHIADTVVMRTSALDVALRSLTWTALDGHDHVPASELRAGDSVLIYGTTYRVVDSVLAVDNAVVVDFAKTSEQQPLFRRYPTAQLCNLNARGLRP